MSEPSRPTDLPDDRPPRNTSRSPERGAGICYYRKAMHLRSIAEELLADARASQDLGVVETAAKLLSLVADIKTDNPSCWELEGACPECPERDRDSAAES